MKINELDHLNLVIPEGGEKQARAFYGELLGLEELARPESLRATSGCWFKLGAVALHLGADKAFVAAKKAHPAFLLSDLDAARAELEAAGFPVTPDTRVPHVRRFYVADPFGNRLEFIQAGDAF